MSHPLADPGVKEAMEVLEAIVVFEVGLPRTRGVPPGGGRPVLTYGCAERIRFVGSPAHD